MKIAYATTFSASDVNNWSGTPFYMSRSLEQMGCHVDYIGNLKRRLPPFFKVKQSWQKMISGQRESPRFNITAAEYYSEQVAQRLLEFNSEVVLAPQILPISYLECQQPIVLWTDALYSSLLGFYPSFYNHSVNSVVQGNAITRACLSRCQRLIFSSDWAARSAIELYGAEPDKVKVIPFGANFHCTHTVEDIDGFLKKRPKDKVKLLFLGKHWDRKGGDIVFSVAKTLHAAGQAVELNFVGCYPPKSIDIPAYIKCHGFISKRTPEGIAKITQLLQESHFLFVPSRAEAYGIVFCEANAFGLPCLTSAIGGISTIVKNHINGMSFSLHAAPEIYCQYIINLMQNYPQYETMAINSFHEYQTRLNWEVAIAKIKEELDAVVG